MKSVLIGSMISASTFLLACQDSQLQSGTQKANSSLRDLPDDQDGQDSDPIVPPTNISGSYLRCAFEAEPSQENPEAIVGCRFENEAGYRTPASELGLSYQFSYEAPVDSSLTIYVKDLVADTRYDALYLFFGPNREILLQEARQTRIAARIEGEFSTGQEQIIKAPLASIERAASEISEPSDEDYRDLRNEILNDAANGEIPPPF